MNDSAAQLLCQLMTQNRRVTKINIENNTFSHKYIDELMGICQRNKLIEKQNTVPKYQDELG